VGPVVQILAPKYVDAVPVVQWSLLIPLLTSLAPVSLMFNVVRRQDLYFVAIVLGMAAYVASLFWLIRDGVSLTAFPQAMAIGRIVYVAMCYAFVAYLQRCASAPDVVAAPEESV
ncbi:MAG: hypothetical protein LLG00_07490, partial [Planctomycetaceae bacterium]|nr:hypothetical protein [Planctomycetaceae bacterium]